MKKQNKLSWRCSLTASFFVLRQYALIGKEDIMSTAIRYKLVQLNEFSKQNKIEDIVKKIHELFPIKEYDQETIQESMYNFVDHREIIYFPNTADSYLEIVYPGGDRFGSMLAHPETDVLIGYEGMEEPLYLVQDNLYVSDNNLIQHMDQILANHTYTKQEIIELFRSNEPSKHLFDKLSPDLKEDNDIVQAIIDCLAEEAQSLSHKKAEQYWYGNNGGFDVAGWEMSTAEQLENLRTTYFPECEENKKINDALLQVYYSSPEIMEKLQKEMSRLENKIEDGEYLEKNKSAYLNQLEDNYKLLQEAQRKYPHLFGDMKEYLKEYACAFDQIKQERSYHDIHARHFYDSVIAEIKGVKIETKNIDQWDIYDSISLKDLLFDLNSYLATKAENLQENIKASEEKIYRMEKKFWKTKSDKTDIKNARDLVELDKEFLGQLQNDMEFLKTEGNKFIEECKVTNDNNLCDMSKVENIISYNVCECDGGMWQDLSFEAQHDLYFFAGGLPIEKQLQKVENMINGILLEKESSIDRYKEIKELYSQYKTEEMNVQNKGYVDYWHNINKSKVTIDVADMYADYESIESQVEQEDEREDEPEM